MFSITIMAWGRGIRPPQRMKGEIYGTIIFPTTIILDSDACESICYTIEIDIGQRCL